MNLNQPDCIRYKKAYGDIDVIVSGELAEIQHQNICGSKLITLSESGHGIVYDQLDKFNSIFMDSIT